MNSEPFGMLMITSAKTVALRSQRVEHLHDSDKSDRSRGST